MGLPNIGVTIVLFVFLIFNMPIIVLIINYLKHSPFIRIKFNLENNSLTLYLKNKHREINFEDVKLLEGVSCKASYPSLSLFWSNFEYSVIHLMNDEKIYVTCLLMNQLYLLRFPISNKYIAKELRFPVTSKN